MRQIIITNGNGLKAKFTNYGARLMSLWVPDSNGNIEDIVLGFNTPEEYLEAEEKYFGVIVGRYANRIANGRFQIDNEFFELAKNHKINHLHGGVKGFHEKIWEVVDIQRNQVSMSYFSEDGEEGYPGNLHVTVHFHLTDDNILRISYSAETDKTTPVNLTHHSYFNLKGEGQGDVLDHILTIYGNEYNSINANLIPTGEYTDVEGTPFDFRTPKPLGKDIDSKHPQILLGNGYDHNYILKKENSSDLIHAATIEEPNSGRKMEVHTNQPGMQLYTANWLSGNDKGKAGHPYHARNAFCLETQHFPDTPNQTSFPQCFIKPDEKYSYCCEYRFVG